MRKAHKQKVISHDQALGSSSLGSSSGGGSIIKNATSSSSSSSPSRARNVGLIIIAFFAIALLNELELDLSLFARSSHYIASANTQATAPKIETPVVIPEQQLHSSRVAPPTGGEEKDPSLLAFSNTLNGIVAVLDEDDKIRGERAEPEVLAKAISYYQHDRPLRDDIFFRRVVNALTDEKPQELTVLMRGSSVSAGYDTVGVSGRQILHQNQTTAFLIKAFKGTSLSWKLLDMAKGSQSSYETFTYWMLPEDCGISYEDVGLIFWEHLLNDECTGDVCPHSLNFEPWLRQFITKYPYAAITFAFVPARGTYIEEEKRLIREFVSRTELKHNQLLSNYSVVQPSRLFSTSLGSYILNSGLDNSTFFDRPGDAHPNNVSYNAMSDITIYHLKVLVREAVDYLQELAEREPSLSAVHQKVHAEYPVVRPSLSAAGGAVVAEKKMEEGKNEGAWNSPNLPEWVWGLPNKDDHDRGHVIYNVMTNDSFMSRVTTFHQPSPLGRDIRGVKIVCHREEGNTTTMEDGLFWALQKLKLECSNLRDITMAERRVKGRVDYEISLIVPACEEYPDWYFHLWVPFSFQRVWGPTVWPPDSFHLIVDDVDMERNYGGGINPVFELPEPTNPEGSYVKLCSKSKDARALVMMVLAFT